MSLMSYWLRHLRNVAARDPVLKAFEDHFAIFTKDPAFRDPLKYSKSITSPHYYVEDLYSDADVKVDKEKLEFHLDMKNFSPEQIDVKTVGNEILVKGKKEIKRDSGWTRSHFERRFLLPEGFPPERVECHLDKGKLVLMAFRSEPITERAIPIQEKKAEEKQAAEPAQEKQAQKC